MISKEEVVKAAGKINYTQVIDPKNISIELLWKLYATSSLSGKEMSAAAYQEIKKSFCVGFIECFKLVNDVASALPEDDACDMFSRLAKEGNEIAEVHLKLSKVIS